MNIPVETISSFFKKIKDAKKIQKVPDERPFIPSIWLKNRTKNIKNVKDMTIEKRILISNKSSTSLSINTIIINKKVRLKSFFT